MKPGPRPEPEPFNTTLITCICVCSTSTLINNPPAALNISIQKILWFLYYDFRGKNERTPQKHTSQVFFVQLHIWLYFIKRGGRHCKSEVRYYLLPYCHNILHLYILILSWHLFFYMYCSDPFNLLMMMIGLNPGPRARTVKPGPRHLRTRPDPGQNRFNLLVNS